MGVQLDTGSDKGVKPNINVTPLVDVVLVLLIIFMLVIPNMQEGVPVELFKADNAIKDEEDAEPMVVSIALVKGTDEVSYHLAGRDGEERELSRDGLIAELARVHQDDPSTQLLFRGDSRIDYGKIREVFHECQNLGFAYIQLAVGAQKDSWDE